MTQITLTVTDPKEASLIKKILSQFDSVTITGLTSKRKSGLEKAWDDVAAGRVTRYDSVDDFFKEMGV